MGHKIRQDHRTASLTTPDIYFGLLTIIVLILLNADQCLLLAVAFYLVLSTLLHPISKETWGITILKWLLALINSVTILSCLLALHPAILTWLSTLPLWSILSLIIPFCILLLPRLIDINILGMNAALEIDHTRDEKSLSDILIYELLLNIPVVFLLYHLVVFISPFIGKLSLLILTHHPIGQGIILACAMLFARQLLIAMIKPLIHMPVLIKNLKSNDRPWWMTPIISIIAIIMAIPGFSLTVDLCATLFLGSPAITIDPNNPTIAIWLTHSNIIIASIITLALSYMLYRILSNSYDVGYPNHHHTNRSTSLTLLLVVTAALVVCLTYEPLMSMIGWSTPTALDTCMVCLSVFICNHSILSHLVWQWEDSKSLNTIFYSALSIAISLGLGYLIAQSIGSCLMMNQYTTLLGLSSLSMTTTIFPFCFIGVFLILNAWVHYGFISNPLSKQFELNFSEMGTHLSEEFVPNSNPSTSTTTTPLNCRSINPLTTV